MAATKKQLTRDKTENTGMRTLMRFFMAAGLVAAALPASAQGVASSGIVAVEGCTGAVLPDSENAELYAFKVGLGGSCTDILFDLRQTGGMAFSANTGDDTNPLYLVDPNWAVAQVGSDVHFIYMVFPPAPGTIANRIMVDSGTTNNQDYSAAAIQTVGNSLPSTYAGSNGKNLVLSSAGSYSVVLAGAAPTAGFPRGANGGIEVAFAPISEVNNNDLVGGGCDPAGEYPNPATGSQAMDGLIIGYNVYRLNGTPGAPPNAQAFYDASLNANPADGFQYFMPLTSSYNLSAPDTTNPGPAPNDSIPNDLGGLQNPDGIMYNGDEVMIFQDSASNRGVNRPDVGSAPVVGQGYWYTFQPVVCGDVDDFTSTGFGPGNNQFRGNHAMNLSSLGGAMDAMDLDLDGNAEFFSPQADVNAGTGLGLTYNGLPVISQPVFGQMDPLPAHGGLTLSGTLNGTNVQLTFQTTLESGDVESFNVYRGTVAGGMLVNEQPILSQGNEGSVYQLVDDAVQARRISKSGVVQYSVQIRYVDGHTSVVGPFDVALNSGQAPARRSR